MTLTERLREYVAACTTGIWIESHEHMDAVTEIARMCLDEDWKLATWDVIGGLSISGGDVDQSNSDPLAAIGAVNALASDAGTAILVLQNFHRFLQSAEIVQTLARQIILGKQNRTFVVILAPVVQIPVELEKLFVVVEHELPGREQLEEIATGIATEEDELPQGDKLERVLDAAAGLTRYEAENAFSLSLVREGSLTAKTLWMQKAQALKKSGLLTLHRGGDDFSSLGGLEALKDFCRRSLVQQSRDNPLKRPRGVMLLSPPGCGKSQFAKSLGNETGRPVLMLDIGSLMGSLVGQSEERTRNALRIADAMAPCILFVDEIEKAFAGVNGQSDSGVSSRMFATFLTWLNDHQSDVYVVCTANDISKLPPEFARAERFDSVAFIDLPSRDEKDLIWELYLGLYELEREQNRPDDSNFTGAEIKACCRLAAVLNVPIVEAARNVVPVAVTSAEAVGRLRTWASGRCMDAGAGGIYQGSGNSKRGRRKVQRGDPSLN
jgi:SpoVK/Ycf46/Vps4 family AAA+-type ATPase